MFLHVTWRGRAAWIYYALRRLIVRPAVDRCCMGGTVHQAVWCPREAMPGELWCQHHYRQLGGEA